MPRKSQRQSASGSGRQWTSSVWQTNTCRDSLTNCSTLLFVVRLLLGRCDLDFRFVKDLGIQFGEFERPIRDNAFTTLQPRDNLDIGAIANAERNLLPMRLVLGIDDDDCCASG